MKIAFAYNLKPKNLSRDSPDYEFYAEFDTLETITGIKKAIEANGHRTLMIEADEDAYEKFRKHRREIDLVFNFSEAVSNTLDREAHIPTILEILKIPYTGPAPLAAALILDKARAKEIWSFNKVSTPEFQVFYELTDELNHKFDLAFNSKLNTKLNSKLNTKLNTKLNPQLYPLIVKPVREGSSSGIRDKSVVNNEKELHEQIKRILIEFKQPAIVEKFLSGREFSVSLIGNGQSLEALPIVEVNFDALPKGVNKIDSYEAKWVWDDPNNPIEAIFCPAKIDEKLKTKIIDAAKRAFITIGCRDWARVDIRLDENNEPQVLELNCPVGLLPDPKENSRMPRSAMEAGMNFEQLIGRIIDAALTRYKKKSDQN
jgi:D-alanine-D-alanine ligase